MDDRPSLISELFRMSAKLVVGGLIVVVLVFFGTMAFVGGIAGGIAGAGGGDGSQKDAYVTLKGEETADKTILRLNLEGPILGHPPKNENPFFGDDGTTYGYELKEKLQEAAEAEEIDAVLLYVSTPGGTIHGSQAIFDGIKAVQAAEKQVIVYVDGISVSGGAWSTAGADKIFADRGSFLAMVGVLGPQLLEFVDPVGLDVFFGTGVDTRGGVKLNWIHAGRGKDFGNPFRAAEQWELDLWQTNLDQSYKMFVDHMVENRGIDRALLLNTIGAGIVSNDQAEQYGFIDGTKTYDDVVAYVEEQIGAGEDGAKIVGPRKEYTSPFGGRIGNIFAAVLPQQQATTPPASHTAALCTELLSKPLVMWQVHLQKMCGK